MMMKYGCGKGNINIGIWNVRSLFWLGALKLVNNELSKLDFDIVGIQEKQLGSCTQKFDTLRYSIVDQKAKNMNLAAEFM